MNPVNRPRTCAECAHSVGNGSCQRHPDIRVKPTSKGCAQGVRVVPAPSETEAML